MIISTRTLYDQLLKEFDEAKTPEERKAISRRIYYEVTCPEADAEYLQYKAMGLSDEQIYTNATKFILTRIPEIMRDIDKG